MIQSDTHTPYQRCLEIQASARGWLAKSQFNYFVTANFNCNTDYRSASKALERWHAIVDRKLLGPKWSKLQADNYPTQRPQSAE